MQVMKGILYELILKLRFCNFHSSKNCLQTCLKADHPLQKNMFEAQRQIIWSLIPNGFVNHGF